MDSEQVLVTLGVRQEEALDGTQVHCNAPCTFTPVDNVAIRSTYHMFSGRWEETGEPRKRKHVDTGKQRTQTRQQDLGL